MKKIIYVLFVLLICGAFTAYAARGGIPGAPEDDEQEEESVVGGEDESSVGPTTSIADSTLRIKATGRSGSSERTIETVLEVEGATPPDYPRYAPFVIDEANLPEDGIIPEDGYPVILKDGGGAGTRGNYGALLLGDGVEGIDEGQIQAIQGAQYVADTIKYGYEGEIDKDLETDGIQISTKPGNMSGPMNQAIAFIVDAGRTTVIVPAADMTNLHGADTITVTENSHYKVEILGIDGNGNNAQINGLLLKQITDDDPELYQSHHAASTDVEIIPLSVAEVKD